jgi:hypothetical protein
MRQLPGTWEVPGSYLLKGMAPRRKWSGRSASDEIKTKGSGDKVAAVKSVILPAIRFCLKLLISFNSDFDYYIKRSFAKSVGRLSLSE